MLVLTRKPGEQVIIANNIRITVVAVGPGRVKIGIEAPPSVSIDRQEVHDRKQVESDTAEVEPLVVGAVPVHNRIVEKLPPAGVGSRSGFRTKPR